jgi:inhibitor of cysteine peptidase
VLSSESSCVILLRRTLIQDVAVLGGNVSAYIYNLTLKDGFMLKGKVTHYDTNEIFQKSGEYFFGGQSDITRSIYINNVLYTLSQSRLQLNDLTSMVTLHILPFDMK